MTTSIERLVESEQELRKISPDEGALGRNASDYHNMYDLFRQVVQQAKTIKLDPTAFIKPDGGYNEKVLNAYTKLVSVAMKALSELNRMRNNDRMREYILQRVTRELVQSISIGIGVELKSILEACDQGQDREEIAFMVRRLTHKRLAEIFSRASEEALRATKTEIGVLV